MELGRWNCLWLDDGIGHPMLSQIRSRQVTEDDLRDGGYDD